MRKFIAKLFFSLIPAEYFQLEIERRIRSNNQLRLNSGKSNVFYKQFSVVNFSYENSNILLGDLNHLQCQLLVFNYGGKIKIGNRAYIGVNSRIWSGESVEIGDDVLISYNVNIIDSDCHEIDYLERAESQKIIFENGYSSQKGSVKTAPIVIGNNVWINFNSYIRKGVRIGDGAIIGACSVVTKDVEPFTLVAGNPAKIVRKLDTK